MQATSRIVRQEGGDAEKKALWFHKKYRKCQFGNCLAFGITFVLATTTITL